MSSKDILFILSVSLEGIRGGLKILVSSISKLIGDDFGIFQVIKSFFILNYLVVVVSGKTYFLHVCSGIVYHILAIAL